MHDLALGLWQDLREKRLWPVAAVLALALLAIPVVLATPAKSPKPTAPRRAVQAHDGLDAIKLRLADLQDGRGSPLDRFHEKNPFLPPGRLFKELKGATSASSSSTATASSAPGAGSPGAAPTGGGSGASGGGGAPAAGVPSGTPPSSGRRTVRVTRYTYVADITFWTNGRRHAYHGIRRLRMLPSEASPFLIFLGVDSSANNTVFLVDSTLTASGEGRCTPSDNQCAVLSLGPGSEEEFTTGDGQSFRLRIDEIRRVRLAHRARASRSARARRSARPRAHATRVTRRFSAPSLTDLMSVANVGEAPSSTSAGSR